MSPDAVSLHDLDASKIFLNKAVSEAKRATEQVRKILLADPDNSLATACATLEAALHTLRHWRTSMLPAEQSELLAHPDWRAFIQMQKMTGSLISEGAKLSRGTATQKLGEGGFGTVYSVFGLSSEPLAYKVYHSAELDNEPKKRLFRRGYDAMHRIGRYPGVVQVYEYTEFPVGFFMELIRGNDLEQKGSGMGDVHLRVRVLVQIAETLTYAHEKDVIHRDVKPANVIIRDSDLRPIVTDFDLAWISGRSTITSAAYASMIYGAPEQFEARLSTFQARPSVDIYSFGALAYYVLTGSEPPPFYGLTNKLATDTLQQRLSGELIAKSVDSLSALIVSCLQHQPSDRPASMGEVVDRMRRIKLMSIDDEQVLRSSEFVREVELGTSLGFTDGRAFSQTGRVQIEVYAKEKSGDRLELHVNVALNGQPSYNVVSHEDYRKSVIRRLRTICDRAVQRLDGDTHNSTARETGMNNWSIRLGGVTSTAKRAWVISDLVLDTISAVE